jgi:predicted amidohydrolase
MITQTLVLGMIERVGDSYYNTALVIAAGRVVGGYRKTFLTAGEFVFAPGDRYPIFECGDVKFGINICYDAQFPQAAAGVAVGGADLLLLPAQNMMPREKAFWWQDWHNLIRAQRVHETGMWLASADVTGERADGRIGLGPTCIIDPAGAVVSHVPVGTIGMAVAEIPARRYGRDS